MGIEETAQDIRSMKIRGAGRIGRFAAAALMWWAQGVLNPDKEAFLSELQKAAETLRETRPTAISLSNAIDLTLRGAQEAESFHEAQELVIGNAETFIKESHAAVERIGTLATSLLETPSTALTICNSSAAISCLVHCHKAGKLEKVFACETRPKGQGFITVRELAEAEVPVTLIVDSSMYQVMSQVDIVMVGADTVEGDGSLINKIGTATLATVARAFGVPVYACAESYKFLPQSRLGSKVEIEERPSEEILRAEELPSEVDIFNPVFDRVPPDLLTGIITEHGIIKPEEAETFIRTHLGGI